MEENTFLFDDLVNQVFTYVTSISSLEQEKMLIEADTVTKVMVEVKNYL